VARRQDKGFSEQHGYAGRYRVAGDKHFEFFPIARQFCFIQMAVAVLNIWIENRTNRSLFCDSIEWVFLCNQMILQELGISKSNFEEVKEAKNMLFDIFFRVFRDDRLFAVFPIALNSNEAGIE
jgi:hypothetical protein